MNISRYIDERITRNDHVGRIDDADAVAAIPSARKVILKNADGSDSPATCRAALAAEYRRWLGEAGVALPSPDCTLELDHSQIDGVDDAREQGIGEVSEHSKVIRVATGADA